jgi:carboxylate-amine ligase
VARAAELAAYAQALAASLRDDPAWSPHPSLYQVYSYNRFQAGRFGFGATIVDPRTREHVPLGDEIVATLTRCLPRAARLGGGDALAALLKAAAARANDARTLREVLEKRGSLPDVVRGACAAWTGP